MLTHSLVGRASKEVMAKLDVDTESSAWRWQGSFQRYLHKEVSEGACIPLPVLLYHPGTVHSPDCCSVVVHKLAWKKITVLNSNCSSNWLVMLASEELSDGCSEHNLAVGHQLFQRSCTPLSSWCEGALLQWNPLLIKQGVCLTSLFC